MNRQHLQRGYALLLAVFVLVFCGLVEYDGDLEDWLMWLRLSALMGSSVSLVLRKPWGRSLYRVSAGLGLIVAAYAAAVGALEYLLDPCMAKASGK